ncbi:LysE family translocator [Sneathiella limimaris]|uniref:LysE family translocator n=1 Tax=Sneathiella limimaris TaxID=1964213 RepID=UPI001469BD4B|nr:LysE family translocator [Sneathiella limimaris]
MTLDMIIALIGFAFVMSISPGPSNFLLMSQGASFGYVRSLPLVTGISAGFLTMVFLVGIGLGEILDTYPVIISVLRYLCGAYVIWLAFQISRSQSIGNPKENDTVPKIGFFQAALFQWVNPKAWAVALIVTVSYTVPENYQFNLLLLIGIFALINIPSISIWAISGALLRRWLSTARRITLFNRTMAVLLIGSMLPVLFNLS